MRLTSYTDFGLRMLMRMASAPERVHSTSDLAAEFGLSRDHLTKIMQGLVRAGVVETRRGRGGGAILTRPPEEIRLGDIVAALEEGQALVECFGKTGNSCVIDGSCRLKWLLRAGERAFLEELNRSNLGDVALAA